MLMVTMRNVWLGAAIAAFAIGKGTMRNVWLGAAIAAFAIGSAAAQDTPKGDAKAGLANFQKYGCYTCHGILGQGSLRDGPRINAAGIGYPALLQQLRTPRYEMP